MAKRYTAKISLPLTPETRGDLEAVSERFNIPVSEVVRECIESDLPRLIERYKKRNSETKTYFLIRSAQWVSEATMDLRKYQREKENATRLPGLVSTSVSRFNPP